MIAIRAAVDADRDAIAHLHEASIRQVAKSHYTAEEIDSWAAGVRPENYSLELMWVAVHDEHVVAFGERNRDEVAAVYVHPDHVGRGIGRMLLDEVEANARAAGVTRLFLNSSLNGQPFYARCGFRPVREATHRTRGGVDIRCVVMEKFLA